MTRNSVETFVFVRLNSRARLHWWADSTECTNQSKRSSTQGGGVANKASLYSSVTRWLASNQTPPTEDRFGREARIAYKAAFRVEQPFWEQLSRRVELPHLAGNSLIPLGYSLKGCHRPKVAKTISRKRPVSHSKVLLTGMLRSCRWRPHPTGQLLPFNPPSKSSLDRLLCFGYRP